MFTLTPDRPPYIRIREGATAAQIRALFACPVPEKIFTGSIVAIPPVPCEIYVARVGDSYASIAEKLCADEESLRSLNGNSPVYPSKKIFFTRR